VGDGLSAGQEAYLAPLRYRALTRWYDAVVDATTRGVEWRSRLARLAAPHEGQMVLDLGCGTGTLAATLARSAPGATILGLDADETALTIAYGKFTPETARLSRGMAQRLPFPDGSFDIVVSSLFFHHLSRDTKRAVLCETQRVLRRGGRLVVADWGRPIGPVTRAGFLLVQFLDGSETTRESVTGELPAMIERAGFDKPREHVPLVTALGVIRFWEARAK
jgi:ubiquinone/menaquinone biosynthesis C-methylase UbiE